MYKDILLRIGKCYTTKRYTMHIKRLLTCVATLFIGSLVHAQVNFIYHNYSIPNAFQNGLQIGHVGTGDFNGDGNADVITAGTYPPDTTADYFYIFLSNTSDSLDAVPMRLSYYSPSPNRHVTAMEVADMNNDSLCDVIVGVGDSIYIYYQTPAHALQLSHKRLYAGQSVNAIRLADIDGDNYKDIVVSVSQQNYLSVFYGTGITDSFVQIQYPAPLFSGKDLKVATVGRRTTPSILRQCNAGSGMVFTETRILPNRQLDTIIYYQIANATSTINGLAAGDRFGNGNNEIVASLNYTFLTWTYPDISSVADSTATLTRPSGAMLMYDLDCDGRDEIIVGATADNALSVITPNGLEQVFYAYIPNGMNYDDMTVSNVIGDAKVDIVIANTYGGVSVLENITDATDSFDLLTNQVQYDSTYTDSNYYTADRQTIIYTNADTVITENDILDLYPVYTDNLLKTSFTGKGYRRCLGDTVNYNSITESVTNYSFVYDTVVITIYYDTTITMGLHSITLPSFNLYPNPAINELYLTSQNVQPLSIIIYDVEGRIICTKPFKNEIDISELYSGLYFVELKNNTGNCWRQRFIKM